MNKKGFTLVELLAVIVILTLLALITTTSVTKIVSDSKTELSNTQIELIKSAAKIWGTENIKRLPGPGECAYITLGDLKKYGIMDSSVNNPLNNQEISDALIIKISNALSEYGKEIISYEVNPESIEGCILGSKRPCEYTESVDGDEMVTCGTGSLAQSFYIIEESADEVVMLAEHNLNTSATPYLQDKTGNINPKEFSLDTYWIDKTYSPAGNSEFLYVYDKDSEPYEYINTYRGKLEEMGVTVMRAKLMSYEQAIKLGCSEDNYDCTSARRWVYETSYWLGSISEDASQVWTVISADSSGYISTYDIDDTDTFGIRPVITIPTFDVQ